MIATESDIPSYVQRVLDGIGLVPRGIQRAAIDRGLLEGKSIMVCSPTGSGKTLVGEMGVLRAVVSGRKGLYVVPLRALALQVATVFRDRYGTLGINVGMSTGDYQTDGSELGKCDVVVTTYERADSLLRRQASWIPEIGTIVIDEVQSISEPRRGARLESSIIRFNELIADLQIIALSATIAAPDELAEWLQCELIESDERPVPLHCKVLCSGSKERMVKDLIMTTVQGNGQAIVFHRTRRETEVEAFRLAPDIGRQLTVSERNRLDKELESLEDWTVRLPSELKTIMHDGTGFHHAGLNARVRNVVERLFRIGLIRVVCATTTLAAGMDLPARTVVVTSVVSPENNEKLLNANRVHQMLGRAGRPGHDKVGFGIVLAGSEGEADELERRYFENRSSDTAEQTALAPKYERATSVLGSPNSTTEQLLVALDSMGEASVQEIEDRIVSQSFLAYCGVRDLRSPVRLINLGEISAVTAIEHHTLSDSLRAAKQKLLGAVSLREKDDTTIGAIVTDWDHTQYTCRYSTRLSTSGLVDGPQCSCGRPIDSQGILCTHLLVLGLSAAADLGSLADYVIPLSLSESSPVGALKNLGLAEAADGDKLRPTRLGRLVNRLYLGLPTTREMIALLPTVEETASLLWLVRHLVSLETGMVLTEQFEQLIAALATTNTSIGELARDAELHEGDVYGLVETARWLLHSIEAIASLGGLSKASETATRLSDAIESRMKRGEPNDND